MENYFTPLFESEFMPHGHCYFWEPFILWSHALSDGIIALAYMVIPLTLIYIFRKRKDFKFIWIMALFSIFIFGCGITHVMDVVTIWNPVYRLDSMARIITALASIGTALVLVKITPDLVRIPSARQWIEINQVLKSTNNELVTTNEELLSANEELSLLNEQLQVANETIQTLSLQSQQRNEEKYKQLAESVSDMFFAMDENLNYTYWNKACEEFIGIPASQALGQHMYGLFPRFKTNGLGAFYEKVLETQAADKMQFVYSLAGPRRLFEINAYPSKQGLSVFVVDRTSLEQTRQELQQEKEKVELALWGGDLGIWERDFIEGALHFNERWTKMLGYELQEVEQTVEGWVKLIHPQDRPVVLEGLRKHVSRELPYVRSQYRLLSKNGKWVWVMSSGKIVAYDALGNPLRMVGVAQDITEVKAAEDNLHFFKYLIDHTHDPIYWIDPHNDFRFAYVNKAACKHYDLEEDTLLSMSIPDWDTNFTPQTCLLFWEQVKEKKSLTIETIHLIHNGSRIPVEVTANYLSYGGREYIAGYFKDITARKQAEQALRDSENFQRTIIEADPDCINLVDREGFLLSINQSGLDLIEADSIEQVKAIKMEQLVLDEYRQAFKEAAEKVFTGENARLVFRIQGLNGTKKWVETHAVPLKNEDSGVNSLLAITRDITERFEAEQKLLELGQRLEGIISSAMDAIITTDASFKVMLFNKAAQGMFGYASGQMIASSLNKLIPERFHERHNKDVEQFSKEGKTSRRMGVHMTLYGVRASGEEFPIEASISQIKVGNKKYFTVILRDISGRMQTELEQKRLNSELLRQNEQLQQYGYVTSHNLRGPVATILGLTAIFDATHPENPTNGVVINNLRDTATKLDTIIKDLNLILDYKLDVTLKIEPVSLQGLLEEVRAGIETSLTKVEVQWVIDFGALPEIKTVKAYLYSILYNLLSNAIKYRKEEGTLIIEVSCHPQEGHAAIGVKDNGIGIDLRRHKEKLFGLYKRFHTHVEGKGLGLHLVKTQVEALGGSIEVESKVGEGTLFQLYLPLKE